MKGDPTTDDGFCGAYAIQQPAEASPVPAGATAADPVSTPETAADRSRLGEWPAARTAELVALFAEGLSRAEIARALGMTRNAIAGKIDRLGLGTPRPKVPVVPRVARIRKQPPTRKIRPRPAQTKPVHRRKADQVDIFGLTARSCRWPLFDGHEAFSKKLYCGDETVLGAPYCDEHCRKAWSGQHEAHRSSPRASVRHLAPG